MTCIKCGNTYESMSPEGECGPCWAGRLYAEARHAPTFADAIKLEREALRVARAFRREVDHGSS